MSSLGYMLMISCELMFVRARAASSVMKIVAESVISVKLPKPCNCQYKCCYAHTVTDNK